ncbi:sigma-70 family RNA polymerase sigma factor [Mycobacterium sp. SMC-4]|uniref:sigma-70 family RNA polymerase sigma factor n=1 Tax=Mycobacterium sp. SMC-4 TaxID=2857059 RepID=UPI0021B4CE0A|nr:sigma-70 family RNA polymerase sigma factor [Mycobacterium sp. SMC-4]UXA18302.1 sigma-70 family RNA polymerase sigma factor [Mycobacterium sp. SMC-4]
MSAPLRKLLNVTVSVAHDSGTEDAFLAQAQQYRRELLAHCYRMTGSLHDAEDLVQETYLRAWKSYANFEGKSSIRTWLYRIATNTCLTALDGRQRRPLPSGLGQPASDPAGEIFDRREITWLEPLPDAPRADPSDPSVIAESRESVRLAFIAALQHLSPRQRAVLVLREVLQWKAAEVGAAIGASTAAVNSLLQRARAQLDEVRPDLDSASLEPDAPEVADLLSRYTSAFEEYDIDRLVELFTADAVWEMPPFDGWYQGPANIVTLSKTHCPAEKAGDMRFLRTTANGQPAVALYMLDPGTGRHIAFQLHVIDVRPDGIAHVVAFKEDGFFRAFGLPEVLAAA